MDINSGNSADETESGPAPAQTDAGPGSENGEQAGVTGQLTVKHSTEGGNSLPPADQTEEEDFDALFEKQRLAKIQQITNHRKAILDMIGKHGSKLGENPYRYGLIELLRHYPDGIKLSLLREVFGDAAELTTARKYLCDDKRKFTEEKEKGTTTLIMPGPNFNNFK